MAQNGIFRQKIKLTENLLRNMTQGLNSTFMFRKKSEFTLPIEKNQTLEKVKNKSLIDLQLVV